MSYFLKKTTPSSKGLYLQIYESFYDQVKHSRRNKCFKTLGYFSDLVKSGISDPIEWANEEIKHLNDESLIKKETKISDISASKNIGYFLLKAILDKLNVDYYINMFSISKNFHYVLSDLVRTLIYSQVGNPGSKLKAYENVIPSLYNSQAYSYDQILDCIEFVGNDYEKFIELFNHQINKKYGRKTNVNFFDCTNYYFEIDEEFEDKQKGPSKEGRNSPIIGQALLLDAEQIPLGMMMYPGNKSEKPYLRKMIEDTKSRYDIKGRTIQVADKGLNCARNIYAAVVEANDGYIFSKSVHGKNLSNIEKEWLLLNNEFNVWHMVPDSTGYAKYYFKECIDDFEYSFVDEDGELTRFTVKEKRIVTFNPSLAKKQKNEIKKQIEKAEKILTMKAALNSEFGDLVKYLNFTSVNNSNEKIKIATSLNTKKIEEDLKFAGYNLLVTSELNMDAKEVYNVYHGLWKIEESFRILKSYLEARPVFLQKRESIYGHFLICYLALTLLRLLEIKEFENALSVSEIVNFIRNFNVTETPEGSYVNTSTMSKTFKYIEEFFGSCVMSNMFLKKRDLDLILKYLI
ncbi:MAG: IS1634 family transposase [Clostridia bacterium]|nr:IS1634 family transposase [Clostridia bacterium]